MSQSNQPGAVANSADLCLCMDLLAGLPVGLPPRSPAVKRSFLTPQHSPRCGVPASRPRLHAPPATVSATVHTAGAGGQLQELRELQQQMSMSPTRHRISEDGGMVVSQSRFSPEMHQPRQPQVEHSHSEVHEHGPQPQRRGSDVDDVADMLAERSLLSPRRLEPVPGNLPVRSLFGDDCGGPAQPLFGFGGVSRGASPARPSSKPAHAHAHAPPSLSPLIASRLGLLGQHGVAQESEHSQHALQGYVAMGLAAKLKEARQSEQGLGEGVAGPTVVGLSSPMKSPSGARRSLFR